MIYMYMHVNTIAPEIVHVTLSKLNGMCSVSFGLRTCDLMNVIT